MKPLDNLRLWKDEVDEFIISHDSNMLDIQFPHRG